MVLIHTTLRSRLASIREYGLLLSYSRSERRPAVWLHTHACNEWAEGHVRMMHDAHHAEIVHIEVETGDLKVTNHGAGLYFVTEDVGVHPQGKAWVTRSVLEAV